ncbi:hypothetical protein [Nocardia jiangsuensis]|uniref:Uncharacterized protein n=1 Tax=Nocardia jiangsuensis TaxID=1691563 RepID=A0ABV8E189_9NOCA
MTTHADPMGPEGFAAVCDALRGSLQDMTADVVRNAIADLTPAFDPVAFANDSVNAILEDAGGGPAGFTDFAGAFADPHGDVVAAFTAPAHAAVLGWAGDAAVVPMVDPAPGLLAGAGCSDAVTAAWAGVTDGWLPATLWGDSGSAGWLPALAGFGVGGSEIPRAAGLTTWVRNYP